MDFGYTILYVYDVPKTVEFYEAAFGLKLRFMHDSTHYAELSTGATTLAFASEDLIRMSEIDFRENTTNTTPPGFEVAFVTEHVEDAYAHAVTAGAIPIKEPAQRPWGQIVAHVQDINGILVELCTPINRE